MLTNDPFSISSIRKRITGRNNAVEYILRNINSFPRKFTLTSMNLKGKSDVQRLIEEN